ncbi:MAG TPA: non-ribosomal peptide synthetase, partial [Longimicrobiaceae bacterium]|nr:non-ribosomal peptide synthetase [Longimicrobiaceae bacterium]
LAGGDVLSPPHVARAAELLPGSRLVNGYGPTEATTYTTCHLVRPEDLDGGAIPIGRALANARHYVLDGEMRPVPVGAPGELYVGGDGVARGYPGRPGLTAEKFVPDPFGGEPGGRLYRTGDRVRWRAGGVLEFLGRIDQQVKVRGFRVEPGEIEAVLRAHPSVNDAAVVLRGDGELRRLVAYVTPAAVDRAALADHAAGLLPEFMLPAAVVALDALPLTPNGKVDRRALPEPDFAAAAAVEFLPPETPTEGVLAGLWEELLGMDGVGAGHSFLALGGHSLLAMRLAAEVLARLDVELPLRAVFETPRLRDLAARIDRMRDEALAALLEELGDDLSPVVA